MIIAEKFDVFGMPIEEARGEGSIYTLILFDGCDMVDILHCSHFATDDLSKLDEIIKCCDEYFEKGAQSNRLEFKEQGVLGKEDQAVLKLTDGDPYRDLHKKLCDIAKYKYKEFIPHVSVTSNVDEFVGDASYFVISSNGKEVKRYSFNLLDKLFGESVTIFGEPSIKMKQLQDSKQYNESGLAEDLHSLFNVGKCDKDGLWEKHGEKSSRSLLESRCQNLPVESEQEISLKCLTVESLFSQKIQKKLQESKMILNPKLVVKNKSHLQLIPESDRSLFLSWIKNQEVKNIEQIVGDPISLIGNVEVWICRLKFDNSEYRGLGFMFIDKHISIFKMTDIKHRSEIDYKKIKADKKIEDNMKFSEDEDDDVQNGFIEDKSKAPEFFFGRDGINDWQHSYKGSDKDIFQIGQYRSGHPYTFLPHRIKFYVEKFGNPDFIHVISNKKSNALKAVYAEHGKDMIQLWSFVNVRQEPGWKAFEKAAHDAGYNIKDFSKGKVDSSHGYWLDEDTGSSLWSEFVKLDNAGFFKEWFKNSEREDNFESNVLGDEDFDEKAKERFAESEDISVDDVDINSKKFKEFLRDERESTAQDWYDDRWNELENDMSDKLKSGEHGIKIYRAITVEDPDEFIFHSSFDTYINDHNGVGVYWAWDEDSAEAHWGHGKGKEIVIHAEAPLSSIDIKTTLMLNMNPSLGRDEAELRLKEKAKVFVLGFEVGGEFILVDKEPLQLTASLSEQYCKFGIPIVNNLHSQYSNQLEYGKDKEWKKQENITNSQNLQRWSRNTLKLMESNDLENLFSISKIFCISNQKIASQEIHQYFQSNNLPDTEKQNLINEIRSGETKHLKLVSSVAKDKNGYLHFRVVYKSKFGFLDNPSNFRIEFEGYSYPDLSNVLNLTFLRIGPRKEFYHQEESIEDDTYSLWLKKREEIQSAVDIADAELKKITGDNKGGLTPDSIKATDEYRTAKGNFDRVFKALRDFNGRSPKEFMRRASKRFSEMIESAIMERQSANFKWTKERTDDGFEINVSDIKTGDHVGNVIISQEYGEEQFAPYEDRPFYNKLVDNEVTTNIQSLDVEDKYQGKGVATNIMNIAISEIKKQYPDDPVFCNASPMGDSGLGFDELVRFYQKFGFKVLGKFPEYKNAALFAPDPKKLKLIEDTNESYVKEESLNEMRTKMLKVDGKEVESILMAGGFGAKIYSAGENLVLVKGRKQTVVPDTDPKYKPIMNYVNLRYMPLDQHKDIQDKFKELLSEELAPIMLPDRLPNYRALQGYPKKKKLEANDSSIIHLSKDFEEFLKQIIQLKHDNVDKISIIEKYHFPKHKSIAADIEVKYKDGEEHVYHIDYNGINFSWLDFGVNIDLGVDVKEAISGLIIMLDEKVPHQELVKK